MKFSLIKTGKNLLIPVLVLVGLCLSACQKLIEIPTSPPNRVSTERVYSDSANAMGALVGLYANFRVGGTVSSINGGSLSIYTGISADEMQPTNSETNVDALYANDLRPNNSYPDEMWASGYKGIYQANAFLEGVTDNAKLSASFQRQARGEALLTRALYYFNLVNIFGRVPLVTTSDYRVNAVLPRASIDALYDLIISDLTTSVSLLTDKYPSAGRLRPNINAARALLSRVYLYRGRWKEASDMATLIINSGLYDLLEPNRVFLDGSREAIWQVLPLSNYNQVAEAAVFIPYSADYVPSYTISNDLALAFEATDKRKQQWLGANVISGTTYAYPAKYKNTMATDVPFESYMIFRIGEQYLIRAEALAQQNLLDNAREDLNKIRNRAGLGVTPAILKDDILAAVAKERRVELFAEWGHRWFDLKRTGKADVVLGPKKSGWQSTDALYPVPQSQTSTNPFLDQNPGYK